MKYSTYWLPLLTALSLAACSTDSGDSGDSGDSDSEQDTGGEADDTNSMEDAPPPADGTCRPYLLEEGQSASELCDPDCDAKLAGTDFPQRLPLCTMECSGNNAMGNEQCGEGFACRFGIVTASGTTWYCVQTCDDGMMCDEGYLGGCSTSTSPNYCQPS